MAGQHWCFLSVPIDDFWIVHFGFPQSAVHSLRSLRDMYKFFVFFLVFSLSLLFFPFFGGVQIYGISFLSGAR